jgi:hypothetical protein
VPSRTRYPRGHRHPGCAIGAAGQSGANVNSGNITGTVAGGSGGLGAEVVRDLSVYPGEVLYVGVGSQDGMDGGWGGFGGWGPKPSLK